MQLNILHRTTYRYARPVALQQHRLMVSPLSSNELTVLRSSLSCSPVADFTYSQDVFGNVIAAATFSEPTTKLEIRAEAAAEQLAPAWPVFQIGISAHSYPFDYSPEDVTDLGALRVPDYLDAENVVERWVRTYFRSVPTDTLSLLKDINNGIASAVAYRTRDEEGTQIPCETLAKASGSCRDIAALFIEAVRILGFGARAVSGYLFDPEAPPGSGSTHAWADVYLPGAGWIAFDPTHRRVGSANLIPVAVGRSNRQIMPIAGGFIGAAEDFLSMDVEVSVTSVWEP